MSDSTSDLWKLYGSGRNEILEEMKFKRCDRNSYTYIPLTPLPDVKWTKV